MREKILNDLKEAMKSKDKEKLSVIRMIKGAMQLEEINKKSELTDEEVIDVIAKQIKTRKESILEFEKGNRPDLKEATEKEIAILEEYMPEQLSEDELTIIIDQVFAACQPESIKDMGKVMHEVTPKVKGKADMGLVSRIVRTRLENL